ncbi:MAG: DUF3943 domain-containing protein [Pseudoflavonifractor sp.]|nr:DUF3943 domain-containing protein [Alloprevotella sp.]MCM1116909.1 DUF3943 domain-containing protein [Pseudoflavonifractor sp.]
MHTRPCLLFRRLLTALFLMASVLTVDAQMPIHLSVRPRVLPDSSDVARQDKHHFWRAAGTVFGMNMGLWAFDRYIQHGDFAYISWETIKENLRHGFIWDNDKMGTNMFLHPYNGSLFYNAARSNGYSYWGSGLFAIAGSAQWELFMENEYPSTNDIIATPIGGMAIGEVCYRVSDIILNDRATGWERFGREAGAFVVSPMRGLTRILNGDAWTHRATTGRRFGVPDVGLEVSGGARILTFGNQGVNDTRPGGAIELNLEYGDRFDIRRAKPYDYFSIRAGLNLINRQPFLSQLNIKGRLMAFELRETPRTHLSLGLYQHFDYYDSDTISSLAAKCPYKLGVPASMGAGLLYRDRMSPFCTADAFLHANAVMLGAVLSDHYFLDERNYNLASGYSVMAGAHFVFGRDRLSVSLSHELYHLFTWKGYRQGTDLRRADRRTLNAQGDKSRAIFGVSELTIDVRILRRLYFSIGVSHYFRSTHYRDYPDVSSWSIAERMMVTWKF